MICFMLAWATLGLWFFEIGWVGLQERYIGGFVVMNNIDVYGGWAVFVSIFSMFLASIIFIIPGLGLMMQEIKKLHQNKNDNTNDNGSRR